MNEKFTVYTDCIHFPLDRPCVYQKNNDTHCPECGKYKKSSEKTDFVRILIVKLGAMGDVLRTTFMLQGLKDLYPKSRISWVVNVNNAGVLEGNALIDEIIPNDGKVTETLAKNFYDVVINLDLAPESLALAKLSNNETILGYSMDNKRNITVSNQYAGKWLKMSAYDELKKANKETYQRWMSKITNLPKDNYEIMVTLSEASVEKAQNFLKNNNIKTDKKIIGINPGAGKRWRLKKWTNEGFIKTAKYFAEQGHIILLLGGTEDEQDINIILNENIPNVYSTGIRNSVPDFFAMINLCDIILCGDTMALHAAAGLKKNIVALFGPTSIAEIEVYGRGTKIQSEKACVGCYKQECGIVDNCMKGIMPEEVIKAIEKYL